MDLTPIREFRGSDGRMVDAALAHVPGFVLGLVSHNDAVKALFDEMRPGLDHLEFLVPSVEDVQLWANRLDEFGIQNSGVKSFDHTAGVTVTFRDPDNIQLEFYALKP